MRFLIASDIHGSAQWCRRLMGEIEREAPDQVILLGDLLYHGPRNPLPEGHGPAEVAAMLNSVAERVVAVRGNCDAEVDQWMLDFPCMADYALVLDGTRRLWCTHGHVWGPDNLPKLAPGTAVLTGHTHVQVNREEGPLRFVNPGSVALPKDGVHGYAMYVDGAFELRAL